MQSNHIKELKSQAAALGRHLRDQHGTELPHSALLEALAAMHNAPDWNALQARPAKAPKASKADAPNPLEGMTAEELLQAAMAKGLTSGVAINAFSAAQNPYERAFAQHARDNCVREGELEFDDPGCLVSLSSDNGAYVQGWYWVPASHVVLEPKSLEELLGYGYELISVLQEVPGTEATVDSERLHYEVTADETRNSDGQPVLRIQSVSSNEAFESFDVPRAMKQVPESVDITDDLDHDDDALAEVHPHLFDEDADEVDEYDVVEITHGAFKLRFMRSHSC